MKKLVNLSAFLALFAVLALCSTVPVVAHDAGSHTIINPDGDTSEASDSELFAELFFHDNSVGNTTDNCSGSCTCSSCTCTGTLSCCVAGCNACFDFLGC